MDATWLIEAVKQVPALAVLCWLANSFMSFIERQSERHEEAEKTRNEAIATQGESCHTFQREVAEKVSAALNENTHALAAARMAIEMQRSK